MNGVFRNTVHRCDLCVVGGGLAGMCAAIAAARRGLSVVIMQDRPLFGGNASGEIRMWVSGATGRNCRETGIIEEIMLENLYRNPERGYPIWDSVLFEFIASEKNITPILNCSCLDAKMDGDAISSVSGWQTTTQSYHTVYAKYFADCSGDSILAPLSGAEFRIGREARAEFSESIAPEISDRKTMGLSCLITARETEKRIKFTPPSFAKKFTRDDLSPYRIPNMDDPSENYWYMEIGGEEDTIADTESLRDRLLAIAFGIWDYIKNSGDYDADFWSLDFVGFLPGKRESRRYVGDHIITQNEVRAEGKFYDTVAFGGWPMDDHNPKGILTNESPNVFHPAPSPYGIPYRSLYSKNVSNLFFAGRNISATHAAMSSTRVMATCALLGQAVGTAAAVACANGTSPRGVLEDHLRELQRALMDDDCYLPGFLREPSELMGRARIETTGSFAEKLTNGNERPIGDEENAWIGKSGDTIDIFFDGISEISEIRMVFDSDLNREHIGGGGYMDRKATLCNVRRDTPLVHLPTTLVKSVRVFVSEDGENFEEIEGLRENKRRLAYIPIGRRAGAVRLMIDETHGDSEIRIFSVDVR